MAKANSRYILSEAPAGCERACARMQGSAVSGLWGQVPRQGGPAQSRLYSLWWCGRWCPDSGASASRGLK